MSMFEEAMSSVFAPLGMIQLALMLLLGATFAYALWRLVIRRDTIEAKALEDMAARRGWTVRRHMAQAGNVAASGKGYRIEIAPNSTSAWSCLVTRFKNDTGSTVIRTTEFTDPTARLDGGLVVIGPGIAEADAQTAASLMGSFSGPLGTMMLGKLLGSDAALATGISFDSEASGPDATVFATPGAPAAIMAEAYAPLVAQWRQDNSGEELFPILIAGPEALRIRLRTDLVEAARLEPFIDHALQARSRLFGK